MAELVGICGRHEYQHKATKRSKFEYTYPRRYETRLSAKPKINSFLIKINRSLGNLNKNTFSGETHLELPKFQLPTFSGDISDWLSFKEIFIRSIDQIPTL
ncbi:hypothetical protein LAZ67_20001405 [Cordylochernes scorpioides]|uniref:Uncharacterized protein n=1 Tax=Cordylochernes scorpioides TaxID=51811 RepID=A0ABY6LK13_9ARAC|nr:hypothetical protein LAZ67_20001405 [Cordylochernes scorpioides]